MRGFWNARLAPGNLPCAVRATHRTLRRARRSRTRLGSAVRSTMSPAIGGRSAGPARVGHAARQERSGVLRLPAAASPPSWGRCHGPDQIRAAYGIQPLLDAGHDGTGRTIADHRRVRQPDARERPGALRCAVASASAPSLTTGLIRPASPPGGMRTGPVKQRSTSSGAHAVAPRREDPADHRESRATQLRHPRGDSAGWPTTTTPTCSRRSYGEAESRHMGQHLLLQQHTIFDKLTAENMTIFASAGDDGAAQPTRS